MCLAWLGATTRQSILICLFEVGDVENIEMYHFVGAPVSAEKKVIVAEETIKNLYDMFEGILGTQRSRGKLLSRDNQFQILTFLMEQCYELIYGCWSKDRQSEIFHR